eukprot:2418085-Prymnesium_polylepis.3
MRAMHEITTSPARNSLDHSWRSCMLACKRSQLHLTSIPMSHGTCRGVTLLLLPTPRACTPRRTTFFKTALAVGTVGTRLQTWHGS